MSETPKRLAPTTSTLRTLFAKSGNQCAFPGCTHPLIDGEGDFIAQICHIEDAMPGDRFNRQMTNEERRSASNLLLLCYQHHIKTNDVSKFSPEKLKEIKKDHESKFTGEYEVESSILNKIYNEFKDKVLKELGSIKNDTTQIKDDTEAIKTLTEGFGLQLEELTSLIKSQHAQGGNEQEFIETIESFGLLINTNRHKSALDLLLDFKEKYWGNFSEMEKYKVLANIGICYLELNQHKKASHYFINSAKAYPSYEKANGFAALGYAIQENKDECLSFIDKTLELNPSNINAYVSLLTLKKDIPQIDELVKLLPEEVIDTSEISFCIGMIAAEKKQYDLAIEWLQRALDLSKNKANIQSNLAAVILESVANPFLMVTMQINHEIRNKIKYCIQLSSEAWEEYKDTDLRKFKAWILVNRGVAKKFLHDFDGAYEDIKLGTEISEYEYNSLRHFCIVSFETKKFDQTLELLDKLNQTEFPSNHETFDISLLKAEVYFNKENYPKAIDCCQEILEDTTNKEIIKAVHGYLINIYLKTQEFELAQKFCDELLMKSPSEIYIYVWASKIQYHLKFEEKAIQLLDSALKLIDINTPKEDIHELSFQYFKLEHYSKALSLFEKITNPEIYSPLSKALIQCYYSLGEVAKALSLCEKISDNHGPIDIITDIHSSIYESIEDFPQAIKICEKHLDVFPLDSRIQTRLAIIFARRKEQNNLKKILSEIVYIDNLSLEERYQLSHLYLSIDEVESGMKIAYETRKKFFHNGNNHLYYTQLFTVFRAATGTLEPPDKIKIHTAFAIKKDENETISYVLSDKKLNLDRDELSVEDSLAKAVLNKKIGDKVVIDRKVGEPQIYIITNVLNQYVYAFQESIKLLSDKFVDVDGFRVFKTEQTGDIHKDLKPILDQLDEFEKHDKQIYKLYNEQKISIGILANYKGFNTIRAWSFVLSNPDLGIYTVSNWEIVRGNISEFAQNSKGIIIELKSLLTLAALNKLTSLEKEDFKKVIPVSAIESIDNIISELSEVGPQGSLSIGKENGQLIREHISFEHTQQNIQHYKSLLQWIENFCEVLPCHEALSMNFIKKTELDAAIGKTTLDAILLAKQFDYYLLADEEMIRLLALQEYKVKSMPTYGLLLHLEGNFDNVIYDYICTSHKFLPVNANILYKCLEKSNFQIETPFTISIQSLSAPYCREKPALMVASEFLFKVYTNSTDKEIRSKVTKKVIESISNNREKQTVLPMLYMILKLRLILFPSFLDELTMEIYFYLTEKVHIH